MTPLEAYKAQIEELLSQNHLEDAANSLIATIGNTNSEAARELKKIAITRLGSLNGLKNQAMAGGLTLQEYQKEEAKILVALSEVKDKIKPEWLPTLSGTEAIEKASPRQIPSLQKSSDPLDMVFKLLLLLLGIVSIGLLVYSALFISTKLEDKLPHLAISFAGTSGGFYGYMRWRIIEMKIA